MEKLQAPTIVTAYELLKEAYISPSFDENQAKVGDSISNLRVLELSLIACEEVSKIYKELKETGRLVGEFDVLMQLSADLTMNLWLLEMSTSNG